MSKPWFGPKTYGYGATPISPEGWIVTILYVALVVGAVAMHKALEAPVWVMPAFLAALTAGLLWLVALKSDGQPWKWRWGGRG